MILRVILRTAGVFCLACALIPLVGYRIFNTGTGALLGLAAVLLVLPRLWSTLLHPFPRLRGMVLALGSVLLVFCLMVSALIAHRAWFNPPPSTGDFAVIVLGSRIYGDQPSLMLRRRLDKAAGYLALNPDAVCIVSGGQGPDEDYSEAYVMRRYLVGIGVDPGRVFLEDQSTNTRQNLRYSRALMDGGDAAVIVTDSFHQLRASVFAASEGLTTTYNISSLTPWGLMPSYWLREILGVSWAWLTIQLGIA